jgi:hypoxanthine phosphoribosyltransferase
VTVKVAFTRQRLAKRVCQLGRTISRDYRGRSLDIVIVLENSFLFGADLVREISRPVVCHFVRSELRDIRMGGYARREVFFSAAPVLRGRDVLVVAAVLNTGVTQDFLLKRLEEGRPRSLRLAVLFDKPASRKVNLQPEYAGFAAASKEWVGYGLCGKRGLYGNLAFVGMATGAGTARRRPGIRSRVMKKQVPRGRGKT